MEYQNTFKPPTEIFQNSVGDVFQEYRNDIMGKFSESLEFLEVRNTLKRSTKEKTTLFPHINKSSKLFKVYLTLQVRKSNQNFMIRYRLIFHYMS